MSIGYYITCSERSFLSLKDGEALIQKCVTVKPDRNPSKRVKTAKFGRFYYASAGY